MKTKKAMKVVLYAMLVAVIGLSFVCLAAASQILPGVIK